MATNPLVAQGNLNRLRASILFPAFPQLNVTPPFLGPNMIRLRLGGQTTAMIPTGTGVVTSPEPFMLVTMTVQLLKSQAFADQFKTQYESNALLGACTVRPDTTTLSPFDFSNTAIQSVDELSFSGTDASFTVSLQATYYINNSMWNL